MRKSIFTLQPSTSYGKSRNSENCEMYPNIVDEAVQVFLCRWDESYPLQDNKKFTEYHFLLRIDKIIMKKKWRDCLLKGIGFPALPVDYGYRDNVRFWFTRHSTPYAIPIPREKGNTLDTVKYACTRFSPNVTWKDEAYAKLLKVPAIFLNGIIEVIVDTAREAGISVITPQFLDALRDKHASER